MLFNSIDFAIFLPICFVIYWFLLKNNIKYQNLFIAVSSYIFYAWWDWRFLSLIFVSTIVDFYVAKKIHVSREKKRKKLLILSLFINIGLLCFFKYYNFFLDNFVSAFSFFGFSFNAKSLSIILPVGISFYTFQTISYSIDIYKKKIKPTDDFISFVAFVSFFPQLVAGPIERAANLLPQFHKKRIFSYEIASDGMRQILWGLFKKIVIADNCAVFVNEIFANYSEYSSSTLFLGAVFFAFQIYGDFSGYSDMAIGIAKLFGFSLMQNFSFPYFSRDIAEFWRRWHISLSTWFRDYIYIPLGGSRVSIVKKIRNIFIIFIVSGFWHGANWTFIIWGLLNAIYFLPLMILNKNRNNLNIIAKDKNLPSLKEIISVIFTFCFTVIAWIFFRSDNVTKAIAYITNLFDLSIFTLPQIISPKIDMLYTCCMLFIFLIFEWINRDKCFGFDIKNYRKKLRWFLYLFFVLLIMFFGVFKNDTFIYFQF
tara:strand:+ start:30277 stop:31722 length:1446 start_codon:yes stop_codon:yes gene_type:complete